MIEMGLSRVRIGEFAWSRIEPEPGVLHWDWLDRAVETLHAAGLGIIMGTPTATPPKWLVDQMPDMVAIDEQGRPRKFGSRRHYCFSHAGYAMECDRIVEAIAQRYGKHPAIVAWQTDNEYGCHDTAVSFSLAARDAFRDWLATRYCDVASLNKAWGNVFWSMEYRDFAEIDLPNLTVTEANPAHWFDFRRFSSDQVVSFNRRQTEILRAHSPGRDIVHNFMGFFTQFDHHAVGRDLDVASWDSYPLGFLEQFWFSEEEKQRYCRQGHPDIAAFHHDLYRGCQKNGRWWVMEQQPGPVNWARYNPAPLPGMVRLWTLEAMAHGAELVSYFRWRQAPFAQEQMHAGLLRPDSADDVAVAEVQKAAAEIEALGPMKPPPKRVALVFDYQSAWVTDIQPQGKDFSALRVAFEYYSALRQLALDIDIVAPDSEFGAYAMVVIPCLPVLTDGLVQRLADFDGVVVVGPRTGSKTENFQIPWSLPPGELQQLIPIKVCRVESLRNGFIDQGANFNVQSWLEHVESEIEPLTTTNSGRGTVWQSERVTYLASGTDQAGLKFVFESLCKQAGLDIVDLPRDIRMRSNGISRFIFNYGSEPVELPEALGGQNQNSVRMIDAAGVLVIPATTINHC